MKSAVSLVILEQALSMVILKFSFELTLLFPFFIPVDPGCSLEDLPKCF